MSKKPISPNYYRGKVVKSHLELSQLARERKSVYHYNWGIKPASVIINMPYSVIVRVIEERKLFTITK